VRVEASNVFACAALCAVLLCAAGLGHVAGAAERGWNQQQVTQTADDLVQALKAMLADPELNSEQATAMEQREHTAAISTAKQILERTDQLKRRLASGYTKDETQPFWDGIAALRGDIQAYSRHSWLPEATAARADKAGDLLDDLGRFYEPTR